MAGTRSHDNLDLTMQDHVNRIARISLQEDDLLTIKTMGTRHTTHFNELGLGQSPKQGNTAEDFMDRRTGPWRHLNLLRDPEHPGKQNTHNPTSLRPV